MRLFTWWSINSFNRKQIVSMNILETDWWSSQMNQSSYDLLLLLLSSNFRTFPSHTFHSVHFLAAADLCWCNFLWPWSEPFPAVVWDSELHTYIHTHTDLNPTYTLTHTHWPKPCTNTHTDLNPACTLTYTRTHWPKLYTYAHTLTSVSTHATVSEWRTGQKKSITFLIHSVYKQIHFS